MHQWNLHLCQAWTPTEESENLKKQICQETFPAKRSLQETNPHFFSWADFVPLKQGQNKQYINMNLIFTFLSGWNDLKWLKPYLNCTKWNQPNWSGTIIIITVLLSSLSYLTWAAHFFSQVSFTSCHWLRKFPWIRWPSNCSMSASALHSLPLTARGWHVGST